MMKQISQPSLTTSWFQKFSVIILTMINEKSQYCNLQLKHTFDIRLYSCSLTYKICLECQYEVKNQLVMSGKSVSI